MGRTPPRPSGSYVRGAMTGTFGVADLEVFYAQRFLRDAADLPDHIRAKVGSSAGMIRRHGIYQSGIWPRRSLGRVMHASASFESTANTA